ncbi:MAG: NAD(P)-dependent oxidoreductase [Roseobacter sp.]
MKTTGIIGIGDMGSGLACNLIKHGFKVTGHDLRQDRMQDFMDRGGIAASSTSEVGQISNAVFVMVMTGDEAKSVILGEDGLVSHLPKGGAVILSVTIKPSEVREIRQAMAGSGLHLIDTPVSGGYLGAQSGTLTMMAAAPAVVLDEFEPVMEAVSANIHRGRYASG